AFFPAQKKAAINRRTPKLAQVPRRMLVSLVTGREGQPAKETIMRSLFLAAVAAIGLSLCATTQNGSAAWVTRTAYRFDPVCGHTVAYPERVWVPDCEVYVPSYSYQRYYGPVYYPHHHHHHWR